MDIIWTSPAKESLYETLNYIEKQIGEVTARNVWKSINKQVDLLISNPCMRCEFLSHPEYQLRFIVIQKRSKVFYSIQGETIYIVLVWDTRQAPELLESRIAYLYSK